MRVLAMISTIALLAACSGSGRSASAGPEPQGTTTTSLSVETPDVTIEPLPDLGGAPDLIDIDGWLQTDIDSLQDLHGKVVVVQFWTFGCSNCKATLPHLQELYAAHAGQDFEIVGIHSPEFAYEKDPDSILEAAGRLGVTWPIALDTNKRTFHAWQGSPAYWPRTYVLDREGHIRFDHIGEGRYQELANTVDILLG